LCRHATAVFELKNVPPGGGGLAVIAGSHQTKFEEERVMTMAEGWRFNFVDTPWTSQQEGWPTDVELHRLEGAAGDCIIFSEKCKHGTIPWSSQTSERRTLFYKYAPFGMHHGDSGYDVHDPALTEAQRRLVEFPEVWFNEQVPEDDVQELAEGSKSATDKATREQRLVYRELEEGAKQPNWGRGALHRAALRKQAKL
jgi:hypothetical protein